MKKLLFLMGFAALWAIGAIEAAPPLSKLPVWAPDKALLSQLAPAAIVKGFSLRPPQGYILRQDSGPSSSQVFGWLGPAHEGGTRPYVMLALIPIPPSEAKKYTLPQFLDKTMESVQRRRTNWKRTPAETGIVNGVSFRRARWSGINTQIGLKMHGFNYVTVVGNQVIQVSSQDVEPHHEQALKLAEASILTFQILKNRKPGE